MSDRGETLRTLEQEVGILIRRIKRVIGERARAVDPSLMPASFLVLSTLHSLGPVRSTALVDLLGVDKGAMSRHVQHLLDLGLVSRERDPADGRAALLEVTAEGRRRLAVIAAQRQELLAERLADWSAADLAEFVALLGRYNRSLSDESELTAV